MVWGAATILMMTSKDMVAPSFLRVVIGAAEGIPEINGVCLTLWYTSEEYALYPSRPEKVKKFFTEEEEIILQRTQRAHNTSGERVTLRGSMTIFAQPQLCVMCLIYFVVIWSSSGYSNCLPSIINGFGYSTVHSQLLTVPYAILGFLSVNLFCFLCHRKQHREAFVIGLATVALAGFAILYAAGDANTDTSAALPRLAALALISLGNYPLIPIMLTWVYVNTIGLSRCALAIPLQNMAGSAPYLTNLGTPSKTMTPITPRRLLTFIATTLIATSPASANGCYSKGETWGDVAGHDEIFNNMNSICNNFAGTFAAGQRKTACTNFGSGNKIDWVVENNQGDSQTLSASDCVAAMTIEINACAHGSEQQHGSFHYQDDPNGGSC
ncbi:hypothetical protein BJY01DRAFT_250015 [Aspergillus pseudoustus]|uniref:Major facilitator superfamily domain-containing protein n=1 Tax=Aspergillus pseudoustus TaxID=1810923 RepID=A0ABR4JK25_9EURO